MAEFLGSFAPCSVSTLAGRLDDEDVICLTCYTVNNPTPAMQSERGAESQKTEVCETFFAACVRHLPFCGLHHRYF